ncbi:MAG: hypothetical protein DDT42_01105 [candidate division WS2 bacterium]|uniref:Uncharacterized protein n=1 Tax=Psychracetigena formicireducens TaxID=2986056 RepID=A0A9E2BGN1_PSYF1|nr:hypothetical protein [Candidatus Psychracetigena formicireducens]
MPKKKEIDFDKEEETKIEDETVVKKKKGKKISINEDEMQEKFVKTFSSIAFLLKIDANYTEKDFETESKELVRLINKNQVLANIITILDPIFLIIGLMTKVIEMAKKVKIRKEQEAQARSESDGGDTSSKNR